MDGPTSLGKEYLALTALFASQGYAILGVDYIGYKSSRQFVHPYIIYPDVNIQSMMNALSRSYSTLVGYFGNRVFEINTFGYSEGATYSLEFSHCWKSQNCSVFKKHPGFSFGKCIAADGAFDVSETQLEFLKSYVDTKSAKYTIENVRVTTLLKPTISSFLAYSFSNYTSSPQNYRMEDILNLAFYFMQCHQLPQIQCDLGKRRMDLHEAFQSTQFNSTTLAQAIGFSALGKTLNGYRYVTSLQLPTANAIKNSINALVKQNLFASEEFTEKLRKANIVQNFKILEPTKTFIFSLARDSVVVPQNSRKLIQKNPFVTNYFFDNNDYHVCDLYPIGFPVDHLKGEIIASIFAIAFLTDKGTEWSKVQESKWSDYVRGNVD